MTSQLAYSMFLDVMLPPKGEADGSGETGTLTLRRLKRFIPPRELPLPHSPLIVFDLETTGLDPATDRIIEIGAVKLVGLEPVAEFSTLVSTDVELGDDITRLTGITPEMLEGQPTIAEALPKFLDFIDGAVLVAHNAEFDLTMVKAASARLGIDLEWPCFCTLKMARELLPALENKRLDTLAAHYGFVFGAGTRHRSIGDVKVTAGVLARLYQEPGALSRAADGSSTSLLATWAEHARFTVQAP